jgi:hypothetical protein
MMPVFVHAAFGEQPVAICFFPGRHIVKRPLFGCFFALGSAAFVALAARRIGGNAIEVFFQALGLVFVPSIRCLVLREDGFARSA